MPATIGLVQEPICNPCVDPPTTQPPRRDGFAPPPTMVITEELFIGSQLADSPGVTFAPASEIASDLAIIQDLAPELDGVELGRMETLSEQQRQKVAGEEHIRFRYEMDVNSDGRQELVLLGSYAADEGRRSFVLIAAPAAGQWARSQLLTFDREFVIGLRYDNRLAVNFCTGCDFGGWIEWTGSAYEFRPYPPSGVPGVE